MANRLIYLFLGLMCGALIVLIVLGFFILRGEELSTYYPPPLVEELTVAEEPISTADSVKVLISSFNIKHPHIVYAQALIETGHFTSAVFRNNNNLFGMRTVKSRPTTQIGVCSSGYGVYVSWEMSVLDYALWQAWSAKRLNEEDYLSLLYSTYAEDESYIFKIKKLCKK